MESDDKLLKKLGFTRFASEHGIYVKGEGENKKNLALYVDDLLLVWGSKESLKSVKESLSEHFKMEDLGSAKYLLGVNILGVNILGVGKTLMGMCSG